MALTRVDLLLARLAVRLGLRWAIVIAGLRFAPGYPPRCMEWWREYARSVGVPVGQFTYGYQGLLDEPGKIASIGAYCSFAQGVTITGLHHPLHHVTTNPALWKAIRGLVEQDVPELAADARNSPVTFGNDCWIGASALILPGLVVGDGAVVAAGAVVTRDVAPYAIVGGVPAREIGRRFPDDLAQELRATAWWDWPPEKLRGWLALMTDPQAFADAVARD